MRYCPACLQTVPDLGSGTYCIADGGKFKDCLKCNCGQMVLPQWRNCSSCGNIVTAYEPSKVVTP